MTRQEQNQFFAVEAAKSLPASIGPRARLWPALASATLHGVLLCVIVLGDVGEPVGVSGAGPLSLFEVGLVGPPSNETRQSMAEPRQESPPEQKRQPEAELAPEDAIALKPPPKNRQQPTPKRRPERAQAQDTAVSGMQREDGSRRQSGGGASDQPADGAGVPAASAAPGDGRPFGFALGEVSGKPKVIQSVQVVYPVEARKKGITGQVLVRFHLDEHGTVSHLHIKSAQPPEVFNRNTLAALRQWRFQPASHNSKAVPVWVELPIEFELR